ncbi:hypothetical protein [Spiroplasma ixodetis]|uniref:hypothetical protein n=1 Tax=Spiroplasma ixodetis TaxID=2141 RepID=UPI002574FBE3|nr:hypothetical protein [Spiroplasma ixodetis]WJG71265.1 hypothetical protein SIXOD_v1c26460 [Spiroplasma ixodetis Y32]
MKKYKIDNSFPFIDQHFNFITSYDDNEKHFYDVLDDWYLKDNGEIDINLLKKKINKIKIILYYISNKKYKCEKTLQSNIKKQSIFLSYNINSIKKLEIFEKQKTTKIFKRTSPHMYLWRKQWNWMSSTMLFKQNRIV